MESASTNTTRVRSVAAFHRSSAVLAVQERRWVCVAYADVCCLSLFTVGGGFFTGRYRSMNADTEPGSRFDPSKGQGQVRLRHTTAPSLRLPLLNNDRDCHVELPP